MTVWPNGSLTEPEHSSPWGYSDGYKGFHWGDDWYGFEHNCAIEDGVVTKIGYNTFGGGGREVYYRLANDDVIVTYHNELEVLVEVGDRLSEGQPFGIQSDTGKTDGIHNHTEVWLGGYRSRRVNPREYIRARIGTKPAGSETALITESDEDEDDMNNAVKTAFYERSRDRAQVNIAFNTTSGFYSEVLSSSGVYNTQVLGMYGSVDNPKISESHALQIKADCQAVRTASK